MLYRHAFAAGIGLLLGTAAIAASGIPPTFDGMVRVKAKKVDAVYLLPNADFRPYKKVMIDPTEVSFRKDWQRDVNQRGMEMGRVSDTDARRILDTASKGFHKIFVQAYEKLGYQVVEAPGADVLRLSTAVINLNIEAPDTMSAGRTYTFSREAGAAELILQARDSLSGQTLGVALDGRETSDVGPFLRNSVTNASAFADVFSAWARASAEGLGELRALSPIDTNGDLRK